VSAAKTVSQAEKSVSKAEKSKRRGLGRGLGALLQDEPARTMAVERQDHENQERDQRKADEFQVAIACDRGRHCHLTF
jgi:hypothetical protein